MSETNKGFRVFVDSNILISALLSEKSVPGKLLKLLIEEHNLIICSYSISEISNVIQRKFPSLIGKWDKFLTTLEFELTYTPSDLTTVKIPPIRDEADIPILVSVIIAQPDILITGDQDFHKSEIQEYVAVLYPIRFPQSFL